MVWKLLNKKNWIKKMHVMIDYSLEYLIWWEGGLKG